MFIHNIYKTLSNSIIFTINPNICWILSTRGSTHKEDRPIIFLTQIEHSIYISEDNLIGIIYCLRMIEWRIWDQLRDLLYRYTILANDHTRALVIKRAVGNAELIPQDIISILQGFILKLFALAIYTKAAAFRVLYDVEVL